MSVTWNNGSLTVTAKDLATTYYASKGLITSGKWYWEITINAVGLNFIGVLGKDIGSSLTGNTQTSTYQRSYSSSGYTRIGSTNTNFAESYKVGDTIGVYLDMDKGTLTYFKNNMLMGTPFTDLLSLGGVYAHFTNANTGGTSTVTANFGESEFIYQRGLINENNIFSLDGSKNINNINKTFILSNGEYKKFNERIDYQEISEKLHPIMTSNTAPSPYVASASSVQGIYEAWRAFNGIISIDNNMWGATYQIVKNQWIQLYLGSKKKCNKILIYAVSATQAPKDFDILGSNNGTDFTLIKEYKNQTTRWVRGTPKEFLFENNTEYSYYRIFIYNNNGDTGYISLDELEFYQHEIINYSPSSWSTVSSTLPNSQQFLDKGMDSLSPLLDRKVTDLEPIPMTYKSEILGVGEIGKVFSKTIDLKKYFDIRNVRTEVR